MATGSVHDLTAAYALDALDQHERARYEEHLAGCEECREQLASLSEAAAALAYVAEPSAPPAQLRGRILEAARRERANVVPLRRRRPVQLLAAATAVAAGVAIAMGVWTARLHDRLGTQRELSAARAAVVAIASQPGARRLPVSGGRGSLIVAPDGSAALVLDRLPRAPAGRTYEAWVIAGADARPAGLFRGGDDSALALRRPVPPGAAVGVTVERSGGAAAPTSAPFVQARA